MTGPSYRSPVTSQGTIKRTLLLFAGFMLFVSGIYYLMAYGRPSGVNGKTLHPVVDGSAMSQSHPPSQQLPVEQKASQVVQTAGTSNDAVTTKEEGSPQVDQSSTSNSDATSSSNISNLTSVVNASTDSDTYLINHPGLCRRRNNDSDVIGVIILVVTSPGNAETRLAIRQTWGTVAQTRPDVRLAFALGRPAQASVQRTLVEEDSRYGDLLQGRFLDTYNNLTLKSLMILNWTRVHCPAAEFLLKIDDDCFLHPSNLLSFLAECRKNLTDTVIYGRVWHEAKPIRDKADKWAVSKEQFSGDAYPDYAGGPSYVISRLAVPALLDASPAVQMVTLEDVFVTGLCAEKAKVPRLSENKFNVGDSPTVCGGRDLITSHRVSPSTLYMMWWFVNDNRFQSCSSEGKDACTNDKNKMILDLLNAVVRNLPH